jgi:large subunit ribosomal protein L24
MSVAALKKCHIKRDDIVIAISGEDAAGLKQGKVLRVLRHQGLAVVEGFNLIKRHTRKSQAHPEGGIIEKEAPMPISKLRKYVEKGAAKAAAPAAKAKKASKKKEE